MYDYQKHYTRKMVKRERRVYKGLLAQYHQLLLAMDEGVFEITVRSESGAVTVPLSLAHSGQVVMEVVELHAKRLQQAEKRLNASVKEANFETALAEKKRAQHAEGQETSRTAGEGMGVAA
jgi:predicted helicase